MDEPRSLAYIALGANLGDRATNLRNALDRLAATPEVRVVKISSFYENPSVGGPADAPAFLNAVAAIETTLEPLDVLHRLLAIEGEGGRVRSRKNDPRAIDLDLILYGDRVIHSPQLTVPHPLMHERDFVLQPLVEIAPEMIHPVLGRTVLELFGALGACNTGKCEQRTLEKAQWICKKT